MEEYDRGVPTLFVIPLIQFFVGCLLFVALLYGHRGLATLTLIVLGVMAGVNLWARISLSGLTCHLMVDKEKIFPDEKITITMRAENRKFLPIWLQMIVPVRGLMQFSTHGKVFHRENALLWYQKTDFQVDLTGQRRGVHQIGPAHILTGDLFAFFIRKRRMEEAHEVIVYPRLVPLQAFPLPRRDFFGVPGARSPVQDPVFILGTRDYQSGQPAKYIHWKASARHHRLQEKVLESTQQEKILLVVDVDEFARHQAEGDFERTLEVVASLATRLDRKGHAVGLVANGDVVGRSSALVPVARNSRQLAAILEVLARLEMKTQGELIDILRNGRALSWGSSSVCFSYLKDDKTAVLREFFRHSKAPATFFACQPRDSSGGDRYERSYDAHRIEEIVLDRVEVK